MRIKKKKKSVLATRMKVKAQSTKQQHNLNKVLLKTKPSLWTLTVQIFCTEFPKWFKLHPIELFQVFHCVPFAHSFLSHFCSSMCIFHVTHLLSIIKYSMKSPPQVLNLISKTVGGKKEGRKIFKVVQLVLVVFFLGHLQSFDIDTEDTVIFPCIITAFKDFGSKPHPSCRENNECYSSSDYKR